MIWSIIQTIGKQGTTLLIFAILALLLNPNDFGILGMALVWIAFIQVFAEIGFGAALIQRQNVNSKYFSTIFFINVGVGVLLTLISIILSRPCAIFFKTPELQPIMIVLSLSFIINSFSLTQIAIAQKELRFKELAIRDISASLIGGVIGIIFALLNFGVWSLVVQLLTTYILGTILLWHLFSWRPVIKEFSFQYARDLWPYSSKIFTFNIVKYFAQNIDKLIIGYFLGSVALGLYTFAFKFVIYPISTIVGAIGIYLFPKYSAMQENLRAINKSYLFVVKTINSIVIPLMVMIAFLSPIIIPTIWGEKWIPAVPLIQIFAVLSILQSFISPIGQLMKSLNRPGWLLNWSIFITILISIFIWLGVHYKGIVGATFGITAAYVLGLPVNYFIIHKLVHIKLRDILNSIYPSIVSSVVMGLLLLRLLDFKIFSGDIKIFVGIFLGVFLYFVCLILFDKPFVSNIYRRLVKV
jgi:PST family polysaccharide transporter